MAKDLILITGATGYVGFATLLEALKTGYDLRAAVRSDAKAKQLQENLALKKALNGAGGALTFVTVPDFQAPHAFDAAMEGVSYVLHIASPVPDPAANVPAEELQSVFVDAAVNSTVSVLEAAKSAGTVKRVVVTSSGAAIMPVSIFTHYDGTVLDAESHPPEIPGPYPNALMAYFASKVAARNKVERWIQDHQPGFDAVQIHPSMVTGRVELASTPEAVLSTSNYYALIPVLGLPPNPLPMPGTLVDIDDVARLHVQALDPRIPGNQSYIAGAEGPDGVQWDAAKEVARKYFAEEVESGVLPCSASQPTLELKLSSGKTEKAFGMKFRSVEEQVRDVVGQYVELKKQQV